MHRKNRLSLALTLFCLSLLAFASCTTKAMKPREKHKPQAVYPGTQMMGKAAEALETPTREEDVAVEEEAETGPHAMLKNEKIEQIIVSEIRELESTPIYFDFDKSDLTPDAQAILKRLAAWMRTNPRFSVRIEGHCDERGADGYNLALGENRANAAEKYIQMLGVEADRISTLSYGEERPVSQGHFEGAWVWNRRAHFVIE